MIPSIWFKEAQERIRPYIQETPLTFDPVLGVFLKWENHQVTGSFKARGALNKILSLMPWEQQRGIVTASAGNHGQGVALAARLVSAPAIVFASEQASTKKIKAIEKLGAQVRRVSGRYAQAEIAGLKYARANDATWISPYNDGQVIAGQGTLVLEVLRQQPDLNQAVWVVPVGGGGLISGVGAALAAYAPGVKVLGVQSEASPFFYAVLKHGTQDNVVELDSLADGLAGPVEANSITIPIVHRTVQDILLVTEAEIAAAIAYAWHNYQEQIEGSAAVSLAAILTGKISKRPAVLILSGGNIQPEVHDQIIQTHPKFTRS